MQRRDYKKVRTGKTEKKWMFHKRLDLWLFRTLSIPAFPRLWHIMNPWPPLNPSDGGKSSRGQPSSWLKFLPNQAPLFLVVPKKLSPWNSFLSFWPKFACVCTKPWCSYSKLTRRRNENKRSLKAMNHVCHHQRGGWCGSLLGSHKPLEVMEEVRGDLYTHTNVHIGVVVHMHPCIKTHTSPMSWV